MDQERTGMSSAAWLLGGAAVGAVAMFLSDPDLGRRRRAVTRDKLRSAANDAGNYMGVATRDLNNRMQGWRAQTRRMLSRERGEADDQVMTARVRECLGRAVSHPGAIIVMAHNGHIRLTGDVLAHEREPLLRAVRAVPGVHDIENLLDARETAEGVPSLQGRGRTRGRNTMRMTPAGSMGMLAGGLLGMLALLRRGSPRLLLTAAGVALVTGGLRGGRLGSRSGMQADGQAIDVHKSIHIDASCEQVFDLWSRYEEFPRFMSNIKEVRDLGNGRSHWVVSGPAGADVEWDAMTTEARRPEILSWRSEPNASVETSGRVRFRPDGDGTRVSVHLRYSPPGGALGQALAAMFAKDPKQQMDEDLQRMKSFIESGQPAGDAARPAAGQPGQSQPTLH